MSRVRLGSGLLARACAAVMRQDKLTPHLHHLRYTSASKFNEGNIFIFDVVSQSLSSIQLRRLSCGAKMAPLLYKLDASPPACAVRMVADIIGLELDFKDPDILALEHKSPDYVKLNPLGTIPVLVDDGFALADSHAIMIYLLSKYGGDKAESLYPSDVRTRATVNQVMFFDTGVLFVRIKVVALPAIMEGMKAPSARQLADLEEAYGMLEAFLSRHQFVAADHITIADLSLASTLSVAESIVKLNADKFPLTAAWYTKMQEEPYFKKIMLPGAAKFDKTMQYYWKKNNQ